MKKNELVSEYFPWIENSCLKNLEHWEQQQFKNKADVTTQLFIQRVNVKLELMKALASLNGLHWTTTGENIFKEVNKTVIQYKLRQNQLRCVTTEGGINM